MSTRSNIGIENPDGTVTAVYCHFDGYLQHNGRLLLEHWTDRAKVEALIALGSLSVLGEEVGEVHPFDSSDEKYHTWCRAYGRDRGEVDVQAQVYLGRLHYLEAMEEYAYLFTREGGWVYSDHGAPFQALTEEACAEES